MEHVGPPFGDLSAGGHLQDLQDLQDLHHWERLNSTKNSLADRLYEVLLAQIGSKGCWRSGDRMPPINMISARYDVSIRAAVDAVAMLKADGLVQVKRGRHGGIDVVDNVDAVLARVHPRLNAVSSGPDVAPSTYVQHLIALLQANKLSVEDAHKFEAGLRQAVAGLHQVSAIYSVYTDQSIAADNVEHAVVMRGHQAPFDDMAAHLEDVVKLVVQVREQIPQSAYFQACATRLIQHAARRRRSGPRHLTTAELAEAVQDRDLYVELFPTLADIAARAGSSEPSTHADRETLREIIVETALVHLKREAVGLQ